MKLGNYVKQIFWCTGWHINNWSIHNIIIIGQFWQRLASIVAVKHGHVETVKVLNMTSICGAPVLRMRGALANDVI